MSLFLQHSRWCWVSGNTDSLQLLHINFCYDCIILLDVFYQLKLRLKRSVTGSELTSLRSSVRELESLMWMLDILKVSSSAADKAAAVRWPRLINLLPSWGWSVVKHLPCSSLRHAPLPSTCSPGAGVTIETLPEARCDWPSQDLVYVLLDDREAW